MLYGEPPVKVEKDHSLPIDALDRMALTIKQGFALPKLQLQTFDGNPLEYWNFIKSFEASIERDAASENEKLMYVLQYTSGEANKAIKCCAVMHPSVGFQNAKKLLEERFGHPFTIASKYVTKLTEGLPLKAIDRAGLLAFADQLKNCEYTLRSIGYLKKNNSADNLRRIIQRLPFHLRTKFVEVADTIQQSGQRANISHKADFVKVKARPANNPVFGSVVDVTRDRAKKFQDVDQVQRHVQWNPALRTPAYNGQFRLSRTHFIRTPVNTDNAHFSVSRVTNSHILSTPLYGHWLSAL
ncbi:uncharacterized protein [Montipora foliosa]|uniref:uncharacterized protein n=1 Tax=Montipora foliosa TaxID=591990 RepID=UPI0035F13A01